MRNRLFYTVKLSSSLLKEYKYDLTLNFEDALAAGLIISLADSQMLKSIRDITGQEVDREQLEKWFEERDKLKKSKNNTKEKRNRIKELQKNIYKMMYIPQYITVVMESVGEYEKIFRKGFYYNGRFYKRMSCSASQARVSTIVFVDDEIREELRKRLDCGRDLNHPLAPSKYNAYFGLYSSAIKTVTTPRFCVVPDYNEIISVDVDFVVETDKDSDDIIEPRTMDIEFNRFDGSGIISPQMAEIWGKDLGEDYTPCQFCLRAAFTKGMVNEFDFVKWCEVNNNGNYIIKDVYGKEKDLREIDVILSESQVKLWDSWSSQEDFERCCKENGIVWGITKYAPKRDKDVLITNYQYLQTLNLDDDMIADLCKDTINYIQGVSYQNKNYAMLFLLGSSMQVPDVEQFLKISDNYWLKSLVLNNDLFNDKYSREKIRDLIVRKIELACLGKLVVRGNYQCIVPDNYAYMEHITGQPVVGLLKGGEFYSQYWNNVVEDGERVKKVDCMRSPLTHFSEHYVVDLKMDEQTEEWYKYSYSGIIVNVHDHHTMNFAGSDYDYDILSTTNNKNFINGVYPNQRVVTYSAKKPKKKLFTEEDLFITDTFSFGNAIGQITNTTSTFVGMMAMFSPDSAEYKQLADRIKAGCAAQSRQIDKTKIGEAVKTLGTVCKQYQHTNPEDDMETRIKKEFYNRILADKKPYFFKYKYKSLHKELNEYDKKHDELAKLHFSKSLEEIKGQSIETLTQEEQTFLYYYDRFLPVVDSNCVMNKICKYIENVDFHIKQKIRSNSEFNYKGLQSESFTINKKIYDKIKEEMETTIKKWEEFSKNNKASKVERSLTSKTQNKFEKDVEWSALKNRLENITSNEEVLANHLIYFFYEEHPSLSKATLWGLVGKQIYENIKNKVREYDFPVKDPYGNIEFLYEKYQLQHLYLNEEEDDEEDLLHLKPENIDGELDDRYI